MAVIADRVTVDDMFTFVPGTIERLIAWLAERGFECRRAVTFLRDPVDGIENDSLEVETGVEVPEGVEGDELVSVRTYPAVRAAVHEHRGPYEGLPAVYEPLREWVVASGLRPGEQTREIYVGERRQHVRPARVPHPCLLAGDLGRRAATTARAVSSGVPPASMRTASFGLGGSSVATWLSSSAGGM